MNTFFLFSICNSMREIREDCSTDFIFNPHPLVDNMFFIGFFFFFWFTSRSAHSEWIIIQKKKNMNVFIPLTMYTGRLNNPCDHPAVYLLWWESCWTHTLTLHLSSYRIRLAFAKKITKLYVCIVTGVLIELREFELKIDGWKTN